MTISTRENKNYNSMGTCTNLSIGYAITFGVFVVMAVTAMIMDIRLKEEYPEHL